MDLHIRKTTTADAEGFIKLKNTVWQNSLLHIFPQEVFDERINAEKNQIEKFRNNKNLNANGNVSYVAVSDTKIIGIANGTILSPYEHYEKLGYADLCAVYISTQFQRIGLGKKFFDIITDELKKQGCAKMVIGVIKDNAQARKAYEKWGGTLDKTYESVFTKCGKKYLEVFYLYDLK